MVKIVQQAKLVQDSRWWTWSNDTPGRPAYRHQITNDAVSISGGLDVVLTRMFAQ
jgi:hypothetical protein